jgi:hypothetical protein
MNIWRRWKLRAIHIDLIPATWERSSYPALSEVRVQQSSGLTRAARGADLAQIYTKYAISRRIFEHEQRDADRAEYGKEIPNELAARRTGEFGLDPPERIWRLSAILRWLIRAEFPNLSRRRLDTSPLCPLIGERRYATIGINKLRHAE